MTDSPKQWFVQTDFGALLGPMPTDVLAEMARTGALLRRDRVREGADGSWSVASDIPNLFNGSMPLLPSSAVTRPAESLLREMSDGSFVMNEVTRKVLIGEAAATHETVSPGLSKPHLADAAVPASTHSDLSNFLRERQSRRPAPLEAASVTPKSDELDFEVDVPLITPKATIQPSTLVEAIDQAESSSSRQSSASVEVERKQDDNPVPRSILANSIESELPPAPTHTWENLAGSPIRRPSKRTAFSTRPSRWKQQWIVWSSTAAALFVLSVAWWFWPSQRFDIYTEYVAIYKEWQQRRETAEDQAGWNEFVTRAKAQINESVPWLEKNAKPGDRKKTLLLYAGRDLQELLDLPRGSPSPHQKRLDAFVSELQKMYAPST